MARKRIEGTRLKSWDDVDATLAQIGQVDRDLQMIEASANERIEQARADMKQEAAPLLERKSALELEIKEYCEANRAEFAKVKTKTLTFGEVGYRLSSKIMIKRVAETLQALKDLAFTGCVRIKEEPDKEAMKLLTDEDLALVGAVRKTENIFGYTVKQEQLS